MNAPWMNQRVQRSQRAHRFRNVVSSLFVGVLCTFPISGVANAEVAGPTAWLIQAAQDTIRGRVIEEGTGQPVADVMVLVSGTDVQTVTNAQGDYVLEVPASGTLVFARLGYRSAEVELAGQERIDLEMAVSAAELAEIVVTGYSSQRRADITGAIASVDMESVGRVTSSSVLQRLGGQVPGVTVTASGSPGGRSTVRIRGVGSFQNNEPLYIIDGTPMIESTGSGSMTGTDAQTSASFANSLNPNDIESIQVLKDASAASIYGARASNGVIIIETKKGSAGPPRFSLDAKFGVASPYRGYDDFLILDPLDYYEVVRRSLVNGGQEFEADAFPQSVYGDPNNPSVPQYIYCGSDVAVVNGSCEVPINEADYTFPDNLIMPGSPGTNWWDAVFGSGSTWDVNLRVAGGGDAQRYSLSFNYYNQEGTAAFNRFQRGTLRFNTDFRFGRLTVGENVSISYDEHFGGIPFDNVGEGTIIGKNMLTQPIVPVFDVNGNFASGKTPGLGNNDNPLKVAWGNKDDVFKNRRMFGNTFLRLDVTDALQLNTSLAFDLGDGTGTNFNPITPENSEANLVTTFSEQRNDFFNWTWTNTLAWNITSGRPTLLAGPGATESGGDHNATLLLGQAAEKNTARSATASIADLTSTDINARFIQDILGDASTKNVNTGGGESTLLSYFGKVDYNYAERYYLSFTLRRDGSSRLGSANRWGTFPAFNIGWRLSQEPFLGQGTFLTNLMLRFGWGITGNQNIAAGRIVDQFGGNTGDTFYDITGTAGDVVPGLRLTAIGNDSLKWEENQSVNVGLDAELLDGRLSLALDVYQRDSDNLLFNPPLPATAGQAAAPIVNVGEVRNRGIDFAIGYRGTLSEDATWNVNFNGAHYKNEIIRIDGDRDFFFGPTTTRFTTTGVTVNMLDQPIGSFFGLVQEGIFQNQAEIDELDAQAPDGVYQDGAAPGRFRFKDVNGDGRVTSADQTIIGDPHPDFTAGLNLGLQWKRWDFNASLFGTFGNDIFDVQKEFYVFRNFNTNVRSDMLDRSATLNEAGEVENPDAIYPRLDVTDDFSRQTSSFYVDDGSYVRLRSFQVGYTVPESLIPGLENVRVWLQGENLFTITGYDGLDPSLPAISSTVAGMDVRDQAQGIDRGVYPTNRTISMGFNVEF